MADKKRVATQEWVENNTLLLTGTKVDRPITGNVEFKTTTTDSVIIRGHDIQFKNYLVESSEDVTVDYTTLEKDGLYVYNQYFKIDENKEVIYTDDKLYTHANLQGIGTYYENNTSEELNIKTVQFSIGSDIPYMRIYSLYKEGGSCYVGVGELERYNGINGTPKYGIRFGGGNGGTTNLIFENTTITSESNVIIPSGKSGTIALIEDLTPTKLIEILSSATSEEITQIKALLA